MKIPKLDRMVNRKAGVSMLSAAIIFSLNAASFAAVEDLDELVARQGRLSNATWSASYLENSSNNYKWQPESVMYTDVTTGKEVWKLTGTKNQDNFYHNDISWAQWSANGKWLAFATTRDTNAFNKDTSRIWMVVQTNGSNLMPVIDGSNRTYNSAHEYFHWSPQIPDVYYDTGDNDNGLNTSGADVYKNTVSANGVSRTRLFTTNQDTGDSTRKKLSKTISGDGKKILLRDVYVSSSPVKLYPCTIYPENEVGCDWDGYSIDRGQGSGYDTMSDTYVREHGGGLFFSGNEEMGYYTYVMPSGTAAWWRLDFTGSAADGGPLYSDNGVSGEVVIMSTKTAMFPPWDNHYYWSHMSPDWWGNRVVFSNMEDDNSPGVAHINAFTHEYDSRSFYDDYGVQHNDWHGFTDYTVSSYTPYAASKDDGLGQRIVSQRYDDKTLTDQQTVCFTHTRENGGSDYSTLPRPFISPDGTKAAWSSEFLNGQANKNDIYWCVISYPKPPINLSASANADNLTLAWERPAYTNRGWPNEETDAPPKSKEIMGYHLWVSNNGDSNWSEVTTGPVSMEYVELAKAPNSVKYYAVTSEEYSHLESRVLSEVLRVSVDGNGNVTSSVYAAEGKSGFWSSAPPAPSSVKVVKMSAQGHYKLTWAEPSNSKIRYYNVYYSADGTPSAIQQNRIASLPVGTSEYLDWNADPSQTGYYVITSVDRQGNEGLAAGPIKPSALPLRFN